MPDIQELLKKIEIEEKNIEFYTQMLNVLKKYKKLKETRIEIQNEIQILIDGK